MPELPPPDLVELHDVRELPSHDLHGLPQHNPHEVRTLLARELTEMPAVPVHEPCELAPHSRAWLPPFFFIWSAGVRLRERVAFPSPGWRCC